MNYQRALEYLQSLTRLGWKLGLESIRALLAEIDNPQAKYPVVHVAGTNGKGSTCAMLAAILQKAGYKTGLFTSPHLVYVGERIKINNTSISQEEIAECLQRLQPLIKKYKCTFFEAITAIAFLYFADKKIDIAVIEVGLGGRLDATNVVTSLISVITTIDIDHIKQLGNTRKSIAKEKAGIIKSRSICISNSPLKSVAAVFDLRCRQLKTEHVNIHQFMQASHIQLHEDCAQFDLRLQGTFYPQLKAALTGEHQIQNAALAVAAANILNAKFNPILPEHIYQGLLQVQWPGRLQTLSQKPRIVIDVAHNPNGILLLKKAIQTIYSYQRLIIVMGVVKDKQYEKMLKTIAPLADLFMAVKADNHRSLSAKKLYDTAKTLAKKTMRFGAVKQGCQKAIQLANENDMVLCTGSHYTVGEFISCWSNERPIKNFF